MDHLCHFDLCLSCFRVCSLLPCGHKEIGPNSWLLFDFVTFPFGTLGQVWYWLVSISDTCCLSYSDMWMLCLCDHLDVIDDLLLTESMSLINSRISSTSC